MSSLKAFLPALSDILRLSRDALHNRQRALVELGLLDVVPGRGPGSGAPLTATNVAGLLISLLAARELRDVDVEVVAICRAKMLPDRKSTSSKPTFQEAVAEALVDDFLEIETIRVTRPWRAQIVHLLGDTIDDYFAKGYRTPFSPPRDAWWTGEFPSLVFSELRKATIVAVSIADNDDGEDD